MSLDEQITQAKLLLAANGHVIVVNQPQIPQSKSSQSGISNRSYYTNITDDLDDQTIVLD